MAELEEAAAEIYAARHARFRSVLDEYGRAVESHSPAPSSVFEELRTAWVRLRTVAPPDSVEASVNEEMVLVSCSRSPRPQAGRTQRSDTHLYELMSDAINGEPHKACGK